MNTTFAACHANCVSALPVRISTEYVNSRDLNLTRTFEPHPFVPQGIALDERCEEVFSIQVSGLAQRLVHTKAKSAVSRHFGWTGFYAGAAGLRKDFR